MSGLRAQRGPCRAIGLGLPRSHAQTQLGSDAVLETHHAPQVALPGGRTAPLAASNPSHRGHRGHRRGACDRGGPGGHQRRYHRAVRPGSGDADHLHRPFEHPVLHHPVPVPDVRGAGVLDAVRDRVRLRGGQEPARRTRPHPGARRAPVRAGAGLPVGHRDRVHRAVPGQPARPRVSRHLRHLHEPGLEHDLQRLPRVLDGAPGHGRGGDRVSALALAATAAYRAAVRDRRPGLERHDEHGWRLVLPGRVRDHQRQQRHLHPAGHRLVRGCGHRAGGRHGHPVGHRDHDRRGGGGRPALLAADGRLGGAVQARGHPG